MHDKIQWLNCVVRYLYIKIKGKSVEIIDLQLLVNSNEMACTKGGCLGLDHVFKGGNMSTQIGYYLLKQLDL